MWVTVLFDLPTDTEKARKEYTKFRKLLLNEGFIMLQFSVYARHCPSEEKANVIEESIIFSLPPDGEVRIINFTDKQFERMKVYFGKSRESTEPSPMQLSFF